MGGGGGGGGVPCRLSEFSNVLCRCFIKAHVAKRWINLNHNMYSGYGNHNAWDNHFKETFNGPQEMHAL